MKTILSLIFAPSIGELCACRRPQPLWWACQLLSFNRSSAQDNGLRES